MKHFITRKSCNRAIAESMDYALDKKLIEWFIIEDLTIINLCKDILWSGSALLGMYFNDIWHMCSNHRDIQLGSYGITVKYEIQQRRI